MKVLICGANGLVGQKVCEAIAQNDEIILKASSKSACKLPLVHHVFELLDIEDKQAVLRTVSEFNPDVIINCAGITQVDQCEQDKALAWQVNVEAVEHLIEACLLVNAKLVHLSTDFVFDGQTGMYSEEDQTNPISYYGVCKLEAEKLIQLKLTNYAIVRTVLVYGVTALMTRSNLILWVKDSLSGNKSINVVDDQFRTPTLAEDLASACVKIALRNFVGIYHISGNELMSVYEIAQRTAEYFNLDHSLMTPISSVSLNQPGRRPPSTGFNLFKANKELNFQPTSLEEGLKLVEKQLNEIEL